MLTEIERFLVFGDSLSDRGAMNASVLAPLSGLKGNSTEGRFTNGYVWFDHFLRQYLGDEKVIGDYRTVGTTMVPDLARTYCIGGLTADSFEQLSTRDKIEQFKEQKKTLGLLSAVMDAMTDPVTGEVLSSLEAMRNLCLRDDEALGVSLEEKKATLVFEWSGANDLITMNKCPTNSAAECAVKARRRHVEKMIQSGYEHFVLFNMPALDLTPRFQSLDSEERLNAQQVVLLFNYRLSQAVEQLEDKYPQCHFLYFDVHEQFQKVYDNAPLYGFDRDKLKSCYLQSKAFKDKGPEAPVDDRMFWDEVHPTEPVHRLIANNTIELIRPIFKFKIVEENIVKAFRRAYILQLDRDRRETCGASMCVRARLDYQNKNLTIEQILHHALKDGGKRTRHVLQELGWIENDHLSSTFIGKLSQFFSEEKASELLTTFSSREDASLILPSAAQETAIRSAQNTRPVFVHGAGRLRMFGRARSMRYSAELVNVAAQSDGEKKPQEACQASAAGF